MSEKLTMFKISRPGMGHCIGDLGVAITELQESFEADDPGDTVTFEIVQMTREEIDALPEFPGW